MRRRLAALALLLLPLSACSYLAGREEYGPTPESYSEYDRVPMRARLYSDYTGMRVYTNRPAYVAIFEVVPGSGAVLLYPAYRSERAYFSGGSNRVIVSSPRPSSFYLNADYSASRRNTPHHYLLVASRRPLHITDMQDQPGSLRRQLGFSRFASLNARQVMNEIADLVLPSENDEDWDSDVITVWPEYRTQLADYGGGGNWVNVRCADGFYVTSPLEWLPYACHRHDGYGNGYGNGGTQAPPPAPHDTSGVKPTDTTGVTVPTRHRPEPLGPETGAGERFAGGRPSIDPGSVMRPGIPQESPRVEPAGAAPADEPQRHPREPRLEPHRFQPQDEPRAAPADGSPRVATPQPDEPRRGEPQPAQPRQEEPRQAEPQREEPHYVAPPREEPRHEEPRQVEPRHEEPQHEEPRSAPPPPPPAPPREEPRSAPPPERFEPRSEPAPVAPAVSRPQEATKPPPA
jgi:hypothetical protein